MRLPGKLAHYTSNPDKRFGSKLSARFDASARLLQPEGLRTTAYGRAIAIAAADSILDPLRRRLD